MDTTSNKDLVVRLIDRVWNGGEHDLLPELWAEATRAEAAGMQSMLTGAFGDLRVEIEDLIAEDDRVVARLTFRGTHTGPFRDIPPTGREVSFTAIRIYRVADGKIAETWANQDSLGLLGQLRSGA
jgi:predicted ester cyclase